MLIDAGPIVAFLHRGEVHHQWAVDQFRRFGRFVTCEPVLAEACTRLAYYGKDPARVIELARDGDWEMAFSVKSNADRIARLMRKYADQPMDFADACIVAMTEKVADCLVLTLDRHDFSVYRRHERAIVPFISPGHG
ncbi:MAG TPA: PIN domain-containing protein [Verrucomicrobiae bacterium]|nr:PIN domain-containing protein [Verrucomicrobiae bacterium]